MEIKVRHTLTALLWIVLSLPLLPLSAQSKKEKSDSLVRLMKAESIQQLMLHGQQHRKAVASTFLHNGTYLISDTALWNVETKVIKATGNVKVIQDETVLTSDKLDYYIDDNLVQFTGTLVQLQNKKRNTLRTRYLDYNTRDSVAYFRNGASMRDEKGQIIESISGSYRSKDKVFTFMDNVNMFSDSVFIKTGRLFYFSDTEKAVFPMYIDFWKGGNMLSAEEGWYDRGNGVFFFKRDVHGLTPEQEMWSDTLYYYQPSGNVLLQGDAQVQDTSRKVAAVADRIFYEDSLSQVMLSQRAAVAMETEQKGQKDTIYLGADTLIYRSIRRCDIPEGTVKACSSRLSDILTDAVTEFRRKAAEEAAKAAAEARQQNQPQGRGLSRSLDKDGAASAAASGEQPEAPAPPQAAPATPPEESEQQPDDTLPRQPVLQDSTAVSDSLQKAALSAPLDSAVAAVDRLTGIVDAPADTLATPADTLAAPADTVKKDTTKFGFVFGIRNVKIFRKDIQVRCDSMAYCDLDSIARFYERPIVWNEGNRQYTSDSLFVLVGQGGPKKASLQSNAFVITQQDTICYDQIKGAEVMAYFDSLDNSLCRFDALGGASALFYIKEQGVLATVNKVESKMLSGLIKDNNIDQVFYFEQPKNNAYPVVQLPEGEKKMKGFEWNPKDRPTGPTDITTLSFKTPMRSYYLSRPRAEFRYTEVYFPGYMPRIRREIAIRDSLARIPRPKIDRTALSDTLHRADSLLTQADSLMIPPVDSLRVLDSLALGTVAPDSLAVQNQAPADSLSSEGPVDPLSVPTVDHRQKRKEEQEMRRKMRIAQRDAREAEREMRWAELDRRDSLKTAAKIEKAREKERAKKLRILLAQRKQEVKDSIKLEKYIAKYRKQYEREQKRKASRQRTPAIKEGRDIPTPVEPQVLPGGSDAVLRDDGAADDGSVLGGGSVPGA